MELGYTILYVPDVPASVAFYEKAFGLPCHFLHESNAYAEMETGQTILAFVDESTISHPFRKNRLDKEPAGIEVCFVTDQVEQNFDLAIKAGAKKVLSPENKSWGQTVAYVQDNNGCLVEICSPLSF